MIQLPDSSHKHWLIKAGAKRVNIIPEDYGWISSGWTSDGKFNNYYISDKDLNIRDFSRCVYISD